VNDRSDSRWPVRPLKGNLKHIIVCAFGIAASTGLICCAAEPHGLATAVRAACQDNALDDRYFGPTFGETSIATLARVQGYSELLQRLDEPSLSCAGNASEAYRLVYAPQVDGTITIRIQQDGTRSVLRVVVTDETTHKVLRESTREVSAEEWKTITAVLDRFDLWVRPPFPTGTAATSTVVVPHGSAWIFEGRRRGYYHALSRASIAREQEFDVVAQALFPVSGVPVPAEFRPESH
jgi:hypothetical protein